MPENTLARSLFHVINSFSGHSDKELSIFEFGLLIVVKMWLVEVDVTSFLTPSN